MTWISWHQKDYKNLILVNKVRHDGVTVALAATTTARLMALYPGGPRWANTRRNIHSLYHMQIVCTLIQADNHASTLSLNFLQAGCSTWCPTNSVKALKAKYIWQNISIKMKTLCDLNGNQHVTAVLTGWVRIVLCWSVHCHLLTYCSYTVIYLHTVPGVWCIDNNNIGCCDIVF